MGSTLALTFALVLTFGYVNAEYQLVWSDEFDGAELNRTNWIIEVNCDGGGNHELECYTDQHKNIRVEDGKLIIQAVPERYKDHDYTSGRIVTSYSLGWKYGRFECRARLPNGKHLWPAIWLMPQNSVYGGWAASGEVDIMEFRGQEPRVIQANLHYGGSWPNMASSGSGEKDMGTDLTADFHNFTLDWTQDTMDFYLDGRKYHHENINRNFYSGRGQNPYTANRQPFDIPFHWILNVAIGGDFFPASRFGTLTPEEAQNWPKPTFEIDYVRVYQQV